MKKNQFFKIDNNCLYCTDNKPSEHFICVSCGTGMCEDCYQLQKEHDEHCFDFHESIEDEELYDHIVKKTGQKYGYMCYACIDHFTDQVLVNKIMNKNI